MTLEPTIEQPTVFTCVKCGAPIEADPPACMSCGFTFGPPIVGTPAAGVPAVSAAGIARWFGLCAAPLILIASTFLFAGGLGPLMWLGHFGEHFVSESHWARNLWTVLAYSFVAVWLGGIAYCLFAVRALFTAVGSAFERPALAGDYLVYAGHAALLTAIINAIWFKFGARDFVYGYFMVAAFLYSVGLAMLALTVRSKTDRPQAAGR